MTIEERLLLHKQFWKGQYMDRPLAGFRIGGYFIADKYIAARHLLVPGQLIEPHMLNVEDFLEDYERLYSQIEIIGQDGFWAAEPYPAIPWMEAILGCSVRALKQSFVSVPPCLEEGAAYFPNTCLEGNPWFEKYMEFVRRLVELSDGRFAVGQPILRGISDVLGALSGQTQMIYGLTDQPEAMKVIAGAIEDVLLKLIKAQYSEIPPFHGGAALGFYHVWTPEKCMWFQEDLTALLSPGMYREIILPNNKLTCGTYEYNAVHLHSSSFHVLDDLLAIDRLRAVEINKDTGGLPVSGMVPVFNKILAAGKKLIIWGNLDQEDLLIIRREVDWKHGVFLCIVTESMEQVGELLQVVHRWSA